MKDPGTIERGSYKTINGRIAHVWEWGKVLDTYAYKGTVEGCGIFCWNKDGKDLEGDEDLILKEKVSLSSNRFGTRNNS